MKKKFLISTMLMLTCLSLFGCNQESIKEKYSKVKTTEVDTHIETSTIENPENNLKYDNELLNIQSVKKVNGKIYLHGIVEDTIGINDTVTFINDDKQQDVKITDILVNFKNVDVVNNGFEAYILLDENEISEEDLNKNPHILMKLENNKPVIINE